MQLFSLHNPNSFPISKVEYTGKLAVIQSCPPLHVLGVFACAPVQMPYHIPNAILSLKGNRSINSTEAPLV